MIACLRSNPSVEETRLRMELSINDVSPSTIGAALCAAEDKISEAKNVIDSMSGRAAIAI
jgi:hypothetical protein